MQFFYSFMPCPNLITQQGMEASAYQVWMVRLQCQPMQTQQGIWQTSLSFPD